MRTTTRWAARMFTAAAITIGGTGTVWGQFQTPRPLQPGGAFPQVQPLPNVQPNPRPNPVVQPNTQMIRPNQPTSGFQTPRYDPRNIWATQPGGNQQAFSGPQWPNGGRSRSDRYDPREWWSTPPGGWGNQPLPPVYPIFPPMFPIYPQYPGPMPFGPFLGNQNVGNGLGPIGLLPVQGPGLLPMIPNNSAPHLAPLQPAVNVPGGLSSGQNYYQSTPWGSLPRPGGLPGLIP